MKHYLLYGYGGACNHGSEAAIKGEISFLRNISPGCRITLSTHFPEYDYKFGVEADEIIGRNMNAASYEEMYSETIKRITSQTICLSVGGDIYCYPNWERYTVIHNAALERGAKSYLWRCSLEPSELSGELLKAVSSHHLIAARESITADALRERGVNNVILTADMAFQLPTSEAELPSKPYIVINLSPLILRKNPAILDAYQILIDTIIERTDLVVAFLPHVEISMDNDMEALSKLNIPKERAFYVPVGLCSEQYKYIVSHSEACVTARTHVAIAAWSSCVPTLVLSYSVKSKGIAKDLGQSDFAVDINTLSAESLCEKVNILLCEKDRIHSELVKSVNECKVTTHSKEIIVALK